MLAVPVAFLGYERWKSGWNPGEKGLLVAAWCAPLAAPAIAMATGLSLTPALLGALIWTALRSRRAEGALAAA